MKVSAMTKAKYLDWLQTKATLINREEHQWGVVTEKGTAYGKTLIAAIEAAKRGDFYYP